ncbi:MAG: ferrous iron transport protein B [Trueperaceae bacterium]|nr:ferrous iron transport protein B [Trueperaceae bacterium]
MPCPRCDAAAGAAAGSPAPGPFRRWCLVGTPNVGKTSLINAVAGSRLEVGNWTGTTVELASAHAVVAGAPLQLVDLPGAYALGGTGAEEDVVLPALEADPDALIVNVVDANHLARDLTLTLELAELGRPMVVVLNLIEQATARGLTLDPAALEAAFGAPVVALRDHRRHGADDLVAAATRAAVPTVRVAYPDAVAAAASDLVAAGAASRWHALATLTDELPSAALAHLATAATGGATTAGGADHAPHGERWAALERAHARLATAGLDPFLAAAEARHRSAHALAAATARVASGHVDPSERVDRWLLHPVVGPFALIVGLALTFHVTFALSDPWVGFFGVVQEVLAGWITALGLPALAESFLAGALVEGVGTVVAFVPVLFVLYVILGILENAGILARVAFLADGLMRAIGLPGRAVLPMVLSIGCTVPAVQATRTLEEPGDRLRVALAIPSIPCSARLPVFVLLAAVFVPDIAAFVLTGLYVLGFAIAIASAFAFKHLLRTPPGSGAMELPSYRWPPLRLVLKLAWARTRAFLQGATGPILIAVVAVWALLSITLPSGVSLFETVARAIAPVFAPLGMDDWRVVGALIPAAVAKEVVLGSLALTLLGDVPGVALGFGEGLAALGAGLSDALHGTLTALWGIGGGDPIDTELGAALGGVLSTGGAVALMVFTLLYMPCVATLAALRKAFGTRWMLFSIGYQTTVAYLMAWLVFLAWP